MIDQRKCYVKFKQNNQIASTLKINQSLNVESKTCDRNNKDMYSCFYESKKLRVCSIVIRNGKIVWKHGPST